MHFREDARPSQARKAKKLQRVRRDRHRGQPGHADHAASGGNHTEYEALAEYGHVMRPGKRNHKTEGKRKWRI